MQLSTIFQINGGTQFYVWRKPENSECGGNQSTPRKPRNATNQGQTFPITISFSKYSTHLP